MAESRKSLWAHAKLSDLGAISASEVADATSTPAANLQNDDPTSVWRSTTLTSVQIDFNLDADILAELVAGPGGYNAFVLGYANLGSTATWLVKTATSQANLTSSPAYTSSPAVAGWKVTAAGMRGWEHVRPWVHSWHNLALDTYRTEAWVRFEITDAAPIGGVSYIQAAKAFVAHAVRPTFHYAPGGGLTPSADLSGARRESLIVDSVTDAESFDAWLDLLWRVGSLAAARVQTSRLSGQRSVSGASGLWFQGAPDDAAYALKRAIFGHLVTPPALVETDPGYRRVALQIVEAV